MSSAQSANLSVLARVVLLIALLLFFGGMLWHGVSVGAFTRFWHDLVDRPDGPMRFRFVLQPVMGLIAAIHDGRADARAHRSVYLPTILRNRQERLGRLREGLNATARIILLGIIIDIVYQAIVLRTFYPNEALIMALLLGLVPYLLFRGLVHRAVRRWQSPQ